MVSRIIINYILIVITPEERTKAKQWYEAETKGIVKKKPVKKESGWKSSQSESASIR